MSAIPTPHKPMPLSSQHELEVRKDPIQDIGVFLPGYRVEREEAHPGDQLILPNRIPITPTRRLVVLIPDGEIDDKALAHRVWELASPTALHILFMALSPSQDDAAYIRRCLADLAHSMNYGGVRTSTQIIVGINWEEAVQEVLHAGDLLICIAKHKIPYRLIQQRQLGEFLSRSSIVPIYMLGGLTVGPSHHKLNQIKEVSVWLVSIVLIVAFAGLQIWIDKGIGNPLSTILNCLSVVLEFFLILKVNEWIG